VVNAMMKAGGKRATPILTANYISRCVPGEARVQVEEISRSKQFDRFEGRLFQGDKEKIRVLGTFAEEKNECFIDRYEESTPEIPPLEECFAIPALPRYTMMDSLDIRLDPACAGWMQGRLAEKSEHRGWVRFRDDRHYDMLSLLLIADCFPPPIFATQGLVAWVPTIEITVSVRNIPVSGWLRCVLRTRYVTCGLLEEDGEVWDGEGRLVAISRQIAQFRNIST
jgi:hypothetical protein